MYDEKQFKVSWDDSLASIVDPRNKHRCEIEILLWHKTLPHAINHKLCPVETGNALLFLASTSQVTSDFRGEQGFMHLVLSLNISAVCTSSLMVGFVSSNSGCLT